jgi:hypothetical protein
MRPWRPARPSASSRLTRSTTLKKRPRAPSRIQARAIAIARWVLPVPADEDDVALVSQELAAGELAHEVLVDGGAGEGELGDVLGQRQLGDRDLVLDRARLLLGDLGLKEVADDLLWLVRPLYGDLDDLVEGGLHAVEPQLAHGGEDLLAFHHTALLRVS